MNPKTIFLGKKNETGQISQFIPRELNPIRVLNTTREIDKIPIGTAPRLVVILNSFPGGINLSLIQKVKTRLNAGAIVCLVDTINRETEIELRSAGLVFLGTPRTFSNFANQIIGSICNHPTVPVPGKTPA